VLPELTALSPLSCPLSGLSPPLPLRFLNKPFAKLLKIVLHEDRLDFQIGLSNFGTFSQHFYAFVYFTLCILVKDQTFSPILNVVVQLFKTPTHPSHHFPHLRTFFCWSPMIAIFSAARTPSCLRTSIWNDMLTDLVL
jgi:hypothetical protein